jgi:hypothetical protein
MKKLIEELYLNPGQMELINLKKLKGNLGNLERTKDFKGQVARGRISTTHPKGSLEKQP